MREEFKEDTVRGAVAESGVVEVEVLKKCGHRCIVNKEVRGRVDEGGYVQEWEA